MRSGFFLTVIVVLALSFPLSSSALAQTNAAPFPRDGAKKLQDNGYFIIWDVTFQPGKSTGALKLPLDQVAMFLTDGPIKYIKPDGTWAIEHNKVGSVRYLERDGRDGRSRGRCSGPRDGFPADGRHAPQGSRSARRP